MSLCQSCIHQVGTSCIHSLSCCTARLLRPLGRHGGFSSPVWAGCTLFLDLPISLPRDLGTPGLIVTEQRKTKSDSAAPWTATHQAPLSMGFSRQEYWSGLPFPSPRNLPDPGIEPRSPALVVDSLPPETSGKPPKTGVWSSEDQRGGMGRGRGGAISCCAMLCNSQSESRSVVPDSLWPHGLYRPWNSPGQNTGVGSLSLLQVIFPTQGSNPGLPHCRWILYQLSHQGSPWCVMKPHK